MGTGSKLSEWEREFIRRTKQAREERDGLTQDKIAHLLGIDQGRYKHYETRTPLPHEFVVPFCYATGRSLEWLFGVETSASKKRQKRAAG